MNKPIVLLTSLLISFSAVAQSTTNVEDSTAIDTTAVEELHEIVVKAPRVIRKADMDLYLPSASAVEVSKNGMQLLSHLMIPSLTINDALGTIRAAGEEVQVRINGRESSIDQVRALRPETIKRVEWIDNPGLRYNGANYVLNVIVTNPTVGGSVQVSARPALNEAWGFYMADAKINSGKSQFEVGTNLKLTNKIHTYRDYTETFTYPDGTSLTRKEDSRGGIADNSFGNFWTSYSYIKPDTTVFMVDARLFLDYSNRLKYEGLLSLSNGMDDILLTSANGNKSTKPSLSVYWEQHLPKKQLIVVDFGGAFLFGKPFSDYIEQRPEQTTPITDVHTLIKDRNQAYAIEANYIKKWTNSRLTAGITYVANRNRSVYENLGGQVFHQRQDKVYFFAEYFQRIKKVTLTAGIGAQYTDFMLKETAQGSRSWNIHPQATVTYGINQNHRFMLSFESWQATPALDETNIAPQQVDGFQWHVGNPNLKTAESYRLTFRYSYNIPRLTGSIGIRAYTCPDAIAPYLYWDNDKLITTYENSQGKQYLSFFVAPQIDIVPGWLMASGYLQYRAERTRGNGYKHYNHDWSGSVSVQLSHWGFVLSGDYQRDPHSIWGEEITWGERYTTIDLSYNWKNWQFGVGMFMPFGTYDQGSKLLNKWNTNEQRMRIDMHIPYISVSYNLQWGRQKSGARKLISADVEADSSTAGSR